MSFVKKAFRKIVDFVKEYWVEIVIVAAVVFTAGVATVGGFSAFAAKGAAMGWTKAIGSTMWAGVTGTAGSMGIGSGASGSMAAATGTTGMGLGGGLGWGSAGLGLNTSAGTYGANAAAQGVAAETISSTAALQGGGIEAGKQAAIGAAEQAAGVAPGSYGAGGSEAVAKATGGEVVKEAGMSTGKAMFASTALTTGANMVQGYVQGKAIEEAQPKSFWGVGINQHEGEGWGAAAPGSGTMHGDVAGPNAIGPAGPSLQGAVQAAEAGALASTRSPYDALMGGNGSSGYGATTRAGQLMDTPGNMASRSMLGQNAPGAYAAAKNSGSPLMTGVDQNLLMGGYYG